MCLAAIYWARVGAVFYGSTRRDTARIDFDDDLIYREIELPPRRRTLVMKQLLRDEALAAFRECERKEDKLPY